MINRIFVVSKVHKEATVAVYTIEKRFGAGELAAIAAMLTNPVSEQYFLNTFPSRGRDRRRYEIGFLPGVTDNVAATVREMIEDRLSVRFRTTEGVYTSVITRESHINPLIQRIGRAGTLPVPRVRLTRKPHVDRINLNIPDAALVVIGREGIADRDGTRRGPLALDASAVKAIQTHFARLGRSPTDVELESLAQTWSEHCKHAMLNSPIDDIPEGLFRRYIKGATEKILKKKKSFCLSVFSDNAGAIAFNKRWAITHKVETHNSPSALDPFGGAVTGIVGVNRDCLGFGLGAKPIANTFGFCVGDLLDGRRLYRDKEQTMPQCSPRRILDGVVAGVASGGNCSGIPTPQGFVSVDEGYRGKPLVFVGTVGRIPCSRIKKGARPGDRIVMIGGDVGLDGIHGATFSSEALHQGSPATAVQIGDPITQKKLSDLLIREARNAGLYTSITDNGAGGLSCSVAEMAKESGGCLVDLKEVPLKYAGLAPWQIWISESQERMTLAVPARSLRTLQLLCNRRGVKATAIGVFTDSGRCVVRYGKETVMDLSMDFLHDGLPKIHLYTKTKPIHKGWIPACAGMTEEGAGMTGKNLLSLLSNPNIAGFSWISEQFDHEVQGTSVIKPLQGPGGINGDATVIRPLAGANRGIVLTQSIRSLADQNDPYRIATEAIETALCSAVAAGADPDRVALLDNFCWSMSRNPGRLWQLKEACRGCHDGALFYGTPFISGKDSMFNDFSGFDEEGKQVTISIPPTILISAIGIIADVRRSVTIDFKVPGDTIWAIRGKKDACDRLARAIADGLVASAIAVHRGGTPVAIARSAMAGLLGADVSPTEANFIVSVDSQKKRAFIRSMNGISCEDIGVVTQTPRVMGVPLAACFRAYRSYET